LSHNSRMVCVGIIME